MYVIITPSPGTVGQEDSDGEFPREGLRCAEYLVGRMGLTPCIQYIIGPLF